MAVQDDPKGPSDVERRRFDAVHANLLSYSLRDCSHVVEQLVLRTCMAPKEKIRPETCGFARRPAIFND